MFRVGHAFENATEWHRRRPDPSWWRDVVPSSTAEARLAPVAEDALAAFAGEADRLGLALDERDLTRIHGLVAGVRAGLAPLRPSATIDLEPDLRFSPPPP